MTGTVDEDFHSDVDGDGDEDGTEMGKELGTGWDGPVGMGTKVFGGDGPEDVRRRRT